MEELELFRWRDEGGLTLNSSSLLNIELLLFSFEKPLNLLKVSEAELIAVSSEHQLPAACTFSPATPADLELAVWKDTIDVFSWQCAKWVFRERREDPMLWKSEFFLKKIL